MSQQILRFKSDVIVGEKRQFVAIATSGVVDSQGEIMNIEDLKKLLPIIKTRGMATNLGHFGINVGDTFDIYFKTFGELIKLYKRNEKVVKILSQYNPNTMAVVTEGQIKTGNKFDDMAWDMLKTGKINGVSIGAKLDPTGKRICDDLSCGNEIVADGAFFELALTGENLTYPIDSRQPANRTSLILALKSEFKEEEHPRDGGKFSKKEGASKKEKEKKPKKKMVTDLQKPWKKKEETEEEAKKEEKLSTEDKQIQKINERYDKIEIPEFKDIAPGEEGYNKEKPWLNEGKTKRIIWESEQREKRLDELGNSDKPWKNRTREEQSQAFEQDIEQLTNHMDIQLKRNKNLTAEIKDLSSKKEKTESKEEKNEIQKSIDEKRVERFETVKRVKKIADTRTASQVAMKSFIQSGNDLRKYLASKMGLPDTQVEKIAQMLEKAKTAESRAIEQNAQQMGKDKKINDAEREKIKKKEEKDTKLDKKLKEKIDDMSPKQIAQEVDKMFKSYNASLNTLLTNNYEMSLKAEEEKKFDKYTVDPSQRRGRPRKQKGEPQSEALQIPETKDFDKKYLRENLLEYAFNKDKYARVEIDRRFYKLFPDATKEYRTPEEIENLMGWDLTKEKEEYIKERIETRREEEPQKQAFLDRKLPEYGSKFDEEDKNRPVKEYAKELRSDLSFLKDQGFKIRVTSKYNAINVNLTPPDDFVAFNPHYDQQIGWEMGAGVRERTWDEGTQDPREVYTPEGKKLLEVTRAYGNQWNWDKSSYDYHNTNYYFNVDLDRPSKEVTEKQKTEDVYELTIDEFTEAINTPPEIGDEDRRNPLEAIIKEEPIIEEKIEEIEEEKSLYDWGSMERKRTQKIKMFSATRSAWSDIENSDLDETKKEEALQGIMDAESIEGVDEVLLNYNLKSDASLKSLEDNVNEMDNRSQEGNPPQEGEFAIAQVMKILASITGRLDNLENMSSAAPMQQEPVPPQEEGQIPPPQEGQPSQVPLQEGEGEEQPSPPPFEGSDEETESEEEIPEEGMEGEEALEGEEEESENPFVEKEEGSEEDEDEEIEPEEIEDEEETKSRKAKALNLKMDEISEAMDEMYSKNTKKKKISVKCEDDDMKTENDEDYQPENIEKDVSMKKPESKNVDDNDVDISAKSLTDCEDCGDETTSDTENNTVVEPAMKSEKTEVETTEEPTITMAQMDKALTKQKEEIFEKLGVKSVETPITTVDANQGGAVDEGGKTYEEIVYHFAQEHGAPHLIELNEFLEE